MRTALLTLALLLSACAHREARRQAKWGAESNVGITTEVLIAKLGPPSSTTARSYDHASWSPFTYSAGVVQQMRLVYNRVGDDGAFCNTTYVTDAEGKAIVGVRLHGPGCYRGLATF